MTESTPEVADFDPADHTADQVIDQLEEATPDEKDRIVSAELAGKKRKSVLAAADVDPSERRDASGRVLNGWEVPPPAQN